MSELPFDDDPTATYRGYRRQTLYCLFRLFDDALPEDFVLEPEGIEDLALYDHDGRLVEVAQVAFDFYWKRIVFVPLVQGRSIEKQAFANMSGVTHPLQQKVEDQLWRFSPEPVPPAAWQQLSLPSWEPQSSWDVFDQFAAVYGGLFHHVDHMADFARCKVDIDELGESVLQDYLSHEIERAQPMFQETMDSAARVLGEIPEWTEETVNSRSDMFACAELLVQMKDAILPTQDFEGEARLTIDDIAEWRDRLKSGFELVGQARCLWIADSLNIDGFNFE